MKCHQSAYLIKIVTTNILHNIMVDAITVIIILFEHCKLFMIFITLKLEQLL